MARAVRLPLWMICRPDALAKVIAAAALVHQTQIPRADSQLSFSFILQESSQRQDSNLRHPLLEIIRAQH